MTLGSNVGRAKTSLSALDVLTAYLVVLFTVPAALTVGALGSVGAPAMILAIASFYWWCWHHIQRVEPPLTSEPEPVRRAALLFLLAMLLVYVHAMSTALPADEISPADSGLLQVTGMMGLVLSSNDGIGTVEKWRTLLRRMAIGGGLIALLAVVQFATHQTFVDQITIPGLAKLDQSSTLMLRAGLGRPSGTATHPIEFAAVVSMLLPISINVARHATRQRSLLRLSAAVIGLSALLSVSRTAIICTVVGFVCLLPSWRGATRLWAALSACGVLVVAGIAVPGLLGTLRGMFLGAAQDSSVQSRTSSWPIAESYLARSPLLGRGYGTFLPKYWIFDNLYLNFIVQAGLIGLGSLLILLLVALYVSRAAARRFVEQQDRDLAQSLFASVAAGSVSLFFFDGFAFPQSAGCLFLAIGMGGAAWRLANLSLISQGVAPADGASSLREARRQGLR